MGNQNEARVPINRERRDDMFTKRTVRFGHAGRRSTLWVLLLAMALVVGGWATLQQEATGSEECPCCSQPVAERGCIKMCCDEAGNCQWLCLRGHYLLNFCPNCTYILPPEDMLKDDCFIVGDKEVPADKVASEDKVPIKIRCCEYYIEGYLGECRQTDAGNCCVMDVTYIEKVTY
jgi:hypothetical protein